ncbi:Flp pilus assembly protein CpaB [Janthinobacterium sp. 17J80-10]|uniref:Flp pilus assembly protein CpaB n=1 Tax=Janthinobacterium sp. 17J80-10 TaxID=2497863 RepID=UPI0010057C87|nr:Flp pilus assembly protein CpaB [Janthinobacterium sp. 17J80-10]QAU33458.1 Flp pilus assembly protein CpaB [Janthinobacterium sp. 17J80-10]
MKNLKAFSLLFLALLIGLAAAVYAAGWISQQAKIASNKVVVATIDIELGNKITPQMLTTVDWPSGSVPAGTFKDLAELQERVAKVSVLRGEPILEGKLAPVGTRGGLSAVIAEGKRAMTVRVNDVVGVAGFALPGNYVDVMVNTQRDGDNRHDDSKQISKTVLEHVLVLAVAQEASRDDTKPKVVSAVTLELSPEDSEKLDLARNVGTLSLVLRNQVDKLSVATVGITKKQLFGEVATVPVKLASAPRQPVSAKPAVARVRPDVQPPSHCIEVIQGGSRTVNCFKNSN